MKFVINQVLTDGPLFVTGAAVDDALRLRGLAHSGWLIVITGGAVRVPRTVIALLGAIQQFSFADDDLQQNQQQQQSFSEANK